MILVTISLRNARHLRRFRNMENKFLRTRETVLKISQAFLYTVEPTRDNLVWVAAEPSIMQTPGEEAEIAKIKMLAAQNIISGGIGIVRKAKFSATCLDSSLSRGFLLIRPSVDITFKHNTDARSGVLNMTGNITVVLTRQY